VLRDFNPAYVGSGSKSVIRRHPRDVRIAPASGPPRVIAVCLRSANSGRALAARMQLFDHLVGAGEQRRWHVEAERLGGFQIDDQFEPCRLHDREVGGLGVRMPRFQSPSTPA
jgi:hypothetical protein